MSWLVNRIFAFKHWILNHSKTFSLKRIHISILVAFLMLITAHPVYAFDTDEVYEALASITFGLAGAITKGIVLLIDVMIPIMTYNSFVTNPVVENGWAVVRDTVNMFFVVVFVIIAFGTIFGHERFKWQQQVPRLLIFAIVINFSKTLCGIMIDFGQVIMLTFANALREIAAGNFIQLLKLNEIYSVSVNQSAMAGIKTGDSGQVIQSFDFFAAGVVSVVMVLFVFSVMIMFVAILLFRIVMLWVLTVIAPLAWFMKGAQDIIKSDLYAEWWKEFKCMVGIGPVLAFFLWLTLAVASAGNMASSSGFTVTADSNNANFASSLLELDNFMSFIIGIAMLMAGLKSAAQFCASDFSGKAVGGMLSTAKKLPAMTAGLGAKGAGLGLRAGAKGISKTPDLARWGIGKLPAGAQNAIGYVRSGVKSAAWGAVGKAGKWSGISTLERAGIKGKAEARDTEATRRMERVKKAGESTKGMKRDTKLELLKSYNAMNKGSMSANQEAEYMALLNEAMSDTRLRDMAHKDGSLQTAWGRMGKKFEADNKHDSAKTDEIRSFKKKNADFTDALDDDSLTWSADDAKDLTASAWGNKDVQGKMGGIQTNIRKADGSGYMSALEAALAGHYGEAQQKAAKSLTPEGKIESLEAQMQAAVKTGDKSASGLVMQTITNQYQSATPEQQHQMQVAMDRMRNGIVAGGGKAQDILKQFDSFRQYSINPNGQGVPPLPATGESTDEYVDNNFRGASRSRMTSAASQFGTEASTANADVSRLDAEIATLEGDERRVHEDTQKKRTQIEELRGRIERATTADVDDAYSQLRSARKALEEAQKKPPGKSRDNSIKKTTAAVAKAESSYNAARSNAQTELTTNKELQDLEKELKTMLDASVGSTRADDIKEKARQVAELKEKAQRLLEAQKRLNDEAKKRP